MSAPESAPNGPAGVDPFQPVLATANAIWEGLGEFQDPDATAEALRSLRAVVKALRLIDDDLADRLADVTSYGDTVLGDRRVTKRQGNNRKAWDHERLVARVVAAGRDERRIDLDTGEVLESEAAAVVRALVACAGIRDWRVTALRERGIDPGEYCETTPGTTRIEVS